MSRKIIVAIWNEMARSQGMGGCEQRGQSCSWRSCRDRVELQGSGRRPATGGRSRLMRGASGRGDLLGSATRARVSDGSVRPSPWLSQAISLWKPAIAQSPTKRQIQTRFVHICLPYSFLSAYPCAIRDSTCYHLSTSPCKRKLTQIMHNGAHRYLCFQQR